jgi:hypothetical protein
VDAFGVDALDHSQRGSLVLVLDGLGLFVLRFCLSLVGRGESETEVVLFDVGNVYF